MEKEGEDARLKEVVSSVQQQESLVKPHPQVEFAPVGKLSTIDLTLDAKRKVNAAKARRKSRSSMGRQSVGKSITLGAAACAYFSTVFITGS
jgi:hypothetical protein